MRGVAEISDRDVGRDSDEVMERRSQAGDLREVKVIAIASLITLAVRTKGSRFPYTLDSYLYRKYVVYFGCHAPRASALCEHQTMRIHDNILRTRCMNVIVYGCTRFYD